MKLQRKGNIECVLNERGEIDILCWTPCEYYHMLAEYLAKGWILIKGNTFLCSPDNRHCVDVKFFSTKETKYLICTYAEGKFEFLGNRTLDLSYEDMKDFLWQMRSLTKLKQKLNDNKK